VLSAKSGKSSLILAFLRLLPIRSGTIRLDSIDITSIPHDDLRQRAFVTVAQDPLTLANETIRLNLDPEGVVSDEVLVSKLISTRLWTVLSTGFEAENEVRDERSQSGDGLFLDHPVLDKKVSELPAFSAGQAQLFALARALVKVERMRQVGARPVILLDEVTASVDAATEAFIHEIGDKEISRMGMTVIMVAHRLGSLENWFTKGRDAVVWMREGVIEGVEVNLERMGDGTGAERGREGMERE
jgi:ATP-binding cassette subfamily C (CFTR/MRP) protein 1